MKSCCLNPTTENLMATLSQDIIKRNADVFNFVRLICAMDGGTSLALDAKWGEGKTFFLKQTQMIFDAYNDYGIEGKVHGMIDKTNIQTLQNIFSKVNPDFKIPAYATVYYDAWENDTDEDPILSLVYSIINSSLVDMSDERFKGILTNIASITGQLVDRVTQRPVFETLKKIRDVGQDAAKIDSLVKEIKSQTAIHEVVDQFLSSIKIDGESGIIIFVDELDRCRPVYAVKLLERIKHYFSNENIKFVFAINKEELQHTISHVYGQNFDASRYLTRFFDLSIRLPEGNKKEYLKHLYPETYDWYADILDDISFIFKFSLREIGRLYDICNISFSYISGKMYVGNWRFEDFSRVCYMLIPLLVALRIYSQSKYTLVIEGNGFEEFKAMIDTMPKVKYIYEDCFFKKRKEYTEEEFNQCLDNFYTLMFKNPEDSLGKSVGELQIYDRDCSDIMRMTSLLSHYCTFDEK